MDHGETDDGTKRFPLKSLAKTKAEVAAGGEIPMKIIGCTEMR